MKVMHTSDCTSSSTKFWSVSAWERCLDCSWRT